MVGDNELLLMSANAYARQRANQAPVPLGWTRLTEESAFSFQAGFSAAAFVNDAGTEVVIAFTGARTLVDYQQAILATSGGWYAQQLSEAIKFVSDVVAMAAVQGAAVTFTGHSLGGGLASTMGVFFEKTARTFDAAPFQSTATNPLLVGRYFREYEDHQHSLGREVSAAFGAYASAANTGIPELRAAFAARESSLTSELHVAGEIVGRVRSAATGIYATSEAIDVTASTLYAQSQQLFDLSVETTAAAWRAGNLLHSVDLLAILRSSPALAAAANALPRLLELMMSKSFYHYDDLSSARSIAFVSHLLRYELGGKVEEQTILPANMATRFGTEASRLTPMGSTGTALTIQSGVIGALIDFYQSQNAAPTSDFIQALSGGIQFDGSRLPANAAGRRGMQSLLDTLVGLQEADDQSRVRAALDSARIWSFQAGSGPLLVPDNSAADAQIGSLTLNNALDGGGGNDVLLGGSGQDALSGGADSDTLIGSAGNDVLHGGAGSDHLSGGAGDDTLTGGTGVDDLYGGDGADTYQFITGDWVDTIDDSDGQGRIVINGVTLAAGEAIASNVWRSADGLLRITRQLYEATAGPQYYLTIRDETGSISILVRNWTAGDLGISLGSSTDPAQVPSDLYPGNTPSGTTAWTLNDLDNLRGSADADRIHGLAGNDALIGREGNDEVFGGAGADVLSGGSGQDYLSGGDNDDVILGDHTDVLSSGSQYGSPAQPFDNAYNLQVWFSGLGWGAGWASSQLFPVSDWRDAPLVLNGFPRNVTTYVAGDRDIIDAGDGNDEVWAGDGDDSVFGGAGNDRAFGGAGGDLMEGGLGDDWLYGDSQGTSADGSVLAGIEYSTTAMDGADKLLGGEGNDRLFGQGGEDRLYGDTGNDTLYGDDNRLDSATSFGLGTPSSQHAADYIEGGEGNDWIDGGGSNDTLYGGNGADTIWGDGVSVTAQVVGNDFIDGGAGDDSLAGGGGADRLFGGEGNDLMTGDSDAATVPVAVHGDDWLDGGSGNDTLQGNGGADVLLGGEGNDSLWGDQGSAGLPGANNGNDRLEGGAGADQLTGGGAIDTLLGGDGNDVLHGDDEVSRVAISVHAADDLDGGAGNDSLYGWGGADTLRGGDGNDYLYGDHASLAVTHHGNDLLEGGDGADTLVGHGGADTLYGGSGKDMLDGDNGSQAVAGNDLLDGGSGADNLYGRSGNDVLAGGDHDDWLDGGEGDDRVSGDQGIDRLFGREGNDVLSGGDGSDSLYGEAGNDDLDGGAGADYLLGGAGNDIYRFGRNTGADTIEESAGTDRIVLAGNIAGSDVTLYRSSDVTQDLVVVIAGSNDQLRISNHFFTDGSRAIEEVAFADGTLWNAAAIAARMINLSGVAANQTGTAGNDTFAVDNTLDGVIESADGGTDLVNSTVTYTLGANVENLTLQGPLGIKASGNSLNNILTGNAANNTFATGGGLDTLIGGAGDDTYVLDAQGTSSFGAGWTSNEIVIEQPGEGYDRARVSAYSATLGANVEELIVNDFSGNWIHYSAAADLRRRMTGNALANVIDASRVTTNNPYFQYGIVLDGGAGADVLIGGVSNDTYVIDSLDDLIVETGVDDYGGQVSVDTVETGIDYSLSRDLENIKLTGAAAVTATGNAWNNVLDGSENTTANVLIGKEGDDRYLLGAGDTIVERAGEGMDTVVIAQGTVQTYLLDHFAQVENIELGSAASVGASSLTGGAGHNRLIGNAYANTLQGAEGDDYLLDSASRNDYGFDVLIGGAGNDLLETSGGLDTLDGGAGDDRILQSGGLGRPSMALILFGRNDGDDVLETAFSGYTSSQITLDSGISQDQVMLARDGYDLLVTLQGDAGSLRVRSFFISSPGYVASVGTVQEIRFADGSRWDQSMIVNRVRAIGSVATTGDDAILGTSGADLIDSLAGNDVVYAAAGNDRLQGSAGNDELHGESGEDTLSGGEDADSLYGGSGADLLDGQRGDDFLQGGAGADRYLFGLNSGHDTISDAAQSAAEQDEMVFSAGINPDHLDLQAANMFDLRIRNSQTGDVIEVKDFFAAERGYASSDRIERIVFADGTLWDQATIIARGARIVGTDQDDAGNLAALMIGTQLYGLAGNDTLYGNVGNDWLEGGAGADYMAGSLGDDTYVVEGADTLEESADSGTDTVRTTLAWTLGANLEQLVLLGSANVNGTGNSLANTLTGNAGKNTLNGGAGADTLVGGAGIDTMSGGSGNDIYHVDVAGDITTEAANQGTDLVHSAVTRTLAANIELLFQTGTAAINGTGNALANLLRGNAGVNTLAGAGGTDILEGGDGNDILSNTSGKSLLNGGAGADTLTGTSGNDLLIGGTGNDTLNTGAGADILVFNSGHGQDTVAVSTVQDNTVSLGGGIVYADLLFQKSGNNLILKTGGSNQIAFTNYYSSTTNRSIDTLQIVIENTSGYNAGSGNAMHNRKLQSFDFDDLVGAFDAARAANPGLSSWALTNALLAEHLGGSDTAARGGDLAYRYGLTGSLADLSFTPAAGILAASGFGTTAQTLQSLTTLQDATPRLS